ncbi:UNVERIFIED_CONTAM: hypothetical protein RMT77_015939 [Armadillidium vulgare]
MASVPSILLVFLGIIVMMSSSLEIYLPIKTDSKLGIVGIAPARRVRDPRNFLKKGLKKIGKGIRNVGKGIKKAVKSVGKGIKKGANEVAHVVKHAGIDKAVKSIGKGIKKGVKSVGIGIKKAHPFVKRFFKRRKYPYERI